MKTTSKKETRELQMAQAFLLRLKKAPHPPWNNRVLDPERIFDLAIKAIGKQIPKRPVKDYSDILEICNKVDRCPRCRSEEVYDDEPYCSHCGQAILWKKWGASND